MEWELVAMYKFSGTKPPKQYISTIPGLGGLRTRYDLFLVILAKFPNYQKIGGPVVESQLSEKGDFGCKMVAV
jgi:hypothetical protein